MELTGGHENSIGNSSGNRAATGFVAWLGFLVGSLPLGWALDYVTVFCLGMFDRKYAMAKDEALDIDNIAMTVVCVLSSVMFLATLWRRSGSIQTGKWLGALLGGLAGIVYSLTLFGMGVAFWGFHGAIVTAVVGWATILVLPILLALAVARVLVRLGHPKTGGIRDQGEETD